MDILNEDWRRDEQPFPSREHLRAAPTGKKNGNNPGNRRSSE